MVAVYDRPRAAGEDVLSWATATGRITAADAAQWRQDIAAGKTSVATVEMIAAATAPGAGVPLTPTGGRPHFAAAAPPPGADPELFARNPAVEQIAAASPGAYRDAITADPNPPTLFATGDLPAFCASGIDPGLLAGTHWAARHAIAAESDPAVAMELLGFASGPDADTAVRSMPELGAHPGNRDYLARVQRWAEGGTPVFAERERHQERQRQQQAVAAAHGQRVAAAAAQIGESEADLWETLGFGHIERQRAERREELQRAVDEGRTIGTAMTPRRRNHTSKAA
jgi:hypothetical protein